MVMFGDGKHMEQGMRVKGKLMLRGESFDVDCFNIRDKSWAKLRPEEIMSAPPVSWMTGIVDENLMFNCNLMDHAGSNTSARESSQSRRKRPSTADGSGKTASSCASFPQQRP
jgi:hypothetical protein